MNGASDNPWQALWTNWSQVAQGALNGTTPAGVGGSAALGRLAETYVAFGRSVLAMATAATRNAPSGNGSHGELGEVLASAFERWAKGEASGEVHASMRDFFGAAPAGLAATLAALTDTGFEERVGNTLLAWTNEVLELPAVGPMRDWQSAAQALGRDVLEQQRAAAGVARHYQQALRAAYARFAAHLRDPQGAPIETLAGLYDSWVDVAEEAYAEVVKAPEFAVDFAAWINAGSRARGRSNALRERLSAQLDLPQRAEINALLERQRAMQLELDRLQQALADAHHPVSAAVSAEVSAAVPAQPEAPQAVASLPSIAAPPAPRPRPKAIVKAPRARAARAGKPPRPAAPKPVARSRSAAEFDIGDILSGGE